MTTLESSIKFQRLRIATLQYPVDGSLANVWSFRIESRERLSLIMRLFFVVPDSVFGAALNDQAVQGFFN